MWSHPWCSNGKTAPGAVHPARCCSHGNKTLQPWEVCRTGILGSWPVRSGSHSSVVYEVAGEKSRTHTHTLEHWGTHAHTHVHSNSQIHQHYSPSCITVTPLCVPDSRAPFLLPGSHHGALAGLNWYSQGPDGWRGAQTGRWEPGFQGMKLISTPPPKNPLLGVTRNGLV